MVLKKEVITYLEIEGGYHSKDLINRNTGDYDEDLDKVLEELEYEGTIESKDGSEPVFKYSGDD